jgi:hypothetical protein
MGALYEYESCLRVQEVFRSINGGAGGFEQVELRV